MLKLISHDMHMNSMLENYKSVIFNNTNSCKPNFSLKLTTLTIVSQPLHLNSHIYTTNQTQAHTTPRNQNYPIFQKPVHPHQKKPHSQPQLL